MTRRFVVSHAGCTIYSRDNAQVRRPTPQEREEAHDAELRRNFPNTPRYNKPNTHKEVKP